MLSIDFRSLKMEQTALREDALPGTEGNEAEASCLDVKELQVGNRLGFVRLSKGDSYMVTAVL